MIFSGKSVLVTGGTGSFGQKFVELALREADPRRLIVFSRDELKQHEMRLNGFNDPRLRFFIGDVRDLDRLRRAMHGVDVVIHAAALKQIEACEYNPIEAIQTNVLGAKNLIDASLDAGVKKLVALSTDKAVNPVNLYGASKLCAEKLFVQSNSYSGQDGARFACVRYGNVVGSRGSVIPVFLSQRASGKITVTDPRMTRFWITLEQGARFVMQSVDSMHGGEIFIPKIPSTNVMELVKVIAPECQIDFVGIRPGEKLHEGLISEDEARHTVEYEDRYVVKPAHPWWRQEHWADGRPLPDGFRYSSDVNSELLSRESLERFVSEFA